MRKQFLLALLPLLAGAVVLFLLFGTERPLPLVKLTDAPRPPPRGDPGTAPLTLSGLHEGFRETGNALRKRRNDLAEAHRQALEQWRGGKLSIRKVEGIEMQLTLARGQVGEIPAEAVHARLAELLDRERQRLEVLHASMLAGSDQVERARLYVSRERHLAGLPIGDPEGRDYEALRVSYLATVKERHGRLVDMGLGNRESLQIEYESLEREFPP